MMNRIIYFFLYSIILIFPLNAQTNLDRKESIALIQKLYKEPWKKLRWGYENRSPEERGVYYKQFYTKPIVEALVFFTKNINNKNANISSLLGGEDPRFYQTEDIYNVRVFLHKITPNTARMRVKYGAMNDQRTEYLLIKEDGKWKIDDQLMDGWFTENPKTQEGNRLKAIRCLLEK